MAEGPAPGPHSHHRSLEELLASWDLGGARDAEPLRAPRCRARRGPAGGSEAESSSSDSGAESPVCMEPPRPPTIRQHAAGSVSAQVGAGGPDVWVLCGGDDVGVGGQEGAIMGVSGRPRNLGSLW